MSIRSALLPALTALVCVGCWDTSGPPGASVQIDAPDRLTDTVEAVIGRVQATVHGEDGRPAASVMVQLHAHGGYLTDDPTRVSGPSEMSLASDDDGRVGTYFVFGREAGPASVVAVFGELEDTVHFEVLPGALARLMPVPADTAVPAGSQYMLAISAADRFGNPRPDVLSSPVLRSLRPEVAVLNGGGVTTLAHGRATFELEALGVRDSAHVSVVPPGTLAVFDTASTGPAPGALLDIETGALSALANVDRAECPAWHPDGVRLLLRGVRLTSPAGAPVDVLPEDAGLDAQCGEVTRDGAWVFFEVRRPTGVSQIWRVRSDGTALEQLTADEDDIDAYSPSPSPDGARFAYVIRYPGRLINSHFIAVRDVATGTVDTITAAVDNPNYIGGDVRQATVAWSPTGEWIAYTAPGHPWYSTPRDWVWGSYVHLVRPDGSDMRRIGQTDVAARNFHPGRVSWSADGRWLAAQLHYPDMRLALIEVATGDVLPLNGATRVYLGPVWRP